MHIILLRLKNTSSAPMYPLHIKVEQSVFNPASLHHCFRYGHLHCKYYISTTKVLHSCDIHIHTTFSRMTRPTPRVGTPGNPTNTSHHNRFPSRHYKALTSPSAKRISIAHHCILHVARLHTAQTHPSVAAAYHITEPLKHPCNACMTTEHAVVRTPLIL